MQDFVPDDGVSPKIAWDLALGATPMRLSVHVIGSEEQRLDLGKRSIVSARLYNEGGHLQVDWSAPNPVQARNVELWSIGYLEARHVALSGAKRIALKSIGLAEVDLGDRVDADLRVDVEGGAGTLVLTMPADVTAQHAIHRVEGGTSQPLDGDGIRRVTHRVEPRQRAILEWNAPGHEVLGDRDVVAGRAEEPATDEVLVSPHDEELVDARARERHDGRARRATRAKPARSRQKSV